MFNRFEIPKQTFIDHYDMIMESIKRHKEGNLIRSIHLIVPGLDLNEIDDKIQDDPEIGHGTWIYTDYYKDGDKLSSVYEGNNDRKYFLYIKEVSEDISDELLKAFFIQQINGFVAQDMNFNRVVKVTNELECVLDDKVIGSLKVGTGLYINYTRKDNLFVGLNGKCKKCLNSLCDMEKVHPQMRFMMNKDECRLKTKLYNRIPEEVKIVRREEYAALMEMMLEVIKQGNFDHSVMINNQLAMMQHMNLIGNEPCGETK